jgi:hypothetical protein
MTFIDILITISVAVAAMLLLTWLTCIVAAEGLFGSRVRGPNVDRPNHDQRNPYHYAIHNPDELILPVPQDIGPPPLTPHNILPSKIIEPVSDYQVHWHPLESFCDSEIECTGCGATGICGQQCEYCGRCL